MPGKMLPRKKSPHSSQEKISPSRKIALPPSSPLKKYDSLVFIVADIILRFFNHLRLTQ